MSTPPVPAPPTATSGAELVRGRLMQQSLGVLLDRVRGAREVLPHLAALERALGAMGSGAIARLPRTALTKICSQLSSLPLPPNDPPLHDLLSRLLDALEGPHRAGNFLSTFGGNSQLQVSEASHSDFAAVSRAYGTTWTDGAPPRQREPEALTQPVKPPDTAPASAS